MKTISLQMDYQRNMCRINIEIFFYLMQKQRFFFVYSFFSSLSSIFLCSFFCFRFHVYCTHRFHLFFVRINHSLFVWTLNIPFGLSTTKIDGQTNIHEFMALGLWPVIFMHNSKKYFYHMFQSNAITMRRMSRQQVKRRWKTKKAFDNDNRYAWKWPSFFEVWAFIQWNSKQIQFLVSRTNISTSLR